MHESLSMADEHQMSSNPGIFMRVQLHCAGLKVSPMGIGAWSFGDRTGYWASYSLSQQYCTLYCGNLVPQSLTWTDNGSLDIQLVLFRDTAAIIKRRTTLVHTKHWWMRASHLLILQRLVHRSTGHLQLVCKPELQCCLTQKKGAAKIAQC